MRSPCWCAVGWPLLPALRSRQTKPIEMKVMRILMAVLLGSTGVDRASNQCLTFSAGGHNDSSGIIVFLGAGARRWKKRPRHEPDLAADLVEAWPRPWRSRHDACAKTVTGGAGRGAEQNTL